MLLSTHESKSEKYLYLPCVFVEIQGKLPSEYLQVFALRMFRALIFDCILFAQGLMDCQILDCRKIAEKNGKRKSEKGLLNV